VLIVMLSMHARATGRAKVHTQRHNIKKRLYSIIQQGCGVAQQDTVVLLILQMSYQKSRMQ
jgi:uncharacterized membrane protein YgdD (TMEM256/DUF423 family)